MNNNDLRDRWKAVKKSVDSKDRDPLSFWDDQKKMQAEDKKLAEDLKEVKRKARELKKTLYKNKYGDTKKISLSFFNKLIKFFKKRVSQIKAFIITRRKHAIGTLAVILLGVGLMVFSSSSNENTATLGESISEGLQISDDTLPREKPQFTILYPKGTSEENYDVVRISPAESDPSYTYLDRFTEDGAIFRVTQQEIPSNFNLEEAAVGFQATDVIQVDNNKIFHGFSEQGGIQSLLFIKEDKLVLIRSPQKFNDDLWANYYLSLD